MFNIQRSERGPVILFSLIIILEMMGYFTGLVTTITIILKRFGVYYYPYMLIGGNLLGLIGSFFYLFFADRIARHKLLIITALLALVSIIIGRLMLMEGITNTTDGFPWSPFFFFAFLLFAHNFCQFFLSMQYWALINDIFRPIQAQRIYPVLYMSSTFGGVIAGLSIPLLSQFIGIDNLLYVWAIEIAFIIIFILLLNHLYKTELRWKPSVEENNSWDFKNYFKQVFSCLSISKLASVLVALTFMFTLIDTIQSFQYNKIANLSFSSETELSNFFGYYMTFRNVLGICFQFLLVNSIFFYFGAFRAMMITPILMLIAFSFLNINFYLWFGIFLHLCWEMTAYPLFDNGLQLAFNAIPVSARGRLRGFCRGIIGMIGAIFGSVLLILINNLTQSANAHIYLVNILGILAALICLITMLFGKKIYITQLIQNIKEQTGATLFDSIESLEERKEPLALQTLIDIVTSPQEEHDREVKGRAMVILMRLHTIPALRPLFIFLEDPDNQLRLYAIKALRMFKKPEKFPFTYNLLITEMTKIFEHDPYDLARIEAGCFLIEHLPQHEMLEFTNKFFQKIEPMMRIATVQTLSKINIELIDYIIFKGLKDSECFVRAECIIALWSHPEYKKYCNIELTNLLCSSSEKDNRAGLKAIVMLKGIPSFLPFIEPLLADARYEVRSLASLACLSSVIEGDPLWDAALEVVVDAVSDPLYTIEKRQEFLSLLPDMRDEIADAIIISFASLPKEQKAIASLGVNRFGKDVVTSTELEINRLSAIEFSKRMY